MISQKCLDKIQLDHMSKDILPISGWVDLFVMLYCNTVQLEKNAFHVLCKHWFNQYSNYNMPQKTASMQVIFRSANGAGTSVDTAHWFVTYQIMATFLQALKIILSVKDIWGITPISHAPIAFCECDFCMTKLLCLAHYPQKLESLLAIRDFKFWHKTSCYKPCELVTCK